MILLLVVTPGVEVRRERRETEAEVGPEARPKNGIENA